MKPFLSIGALFLAVGTSALVAQAEKQWDPNLLMMGVGPALKEAGFDLNNPESLILAARHEGSLDSPLVRGGAAYGLGTFAPSPRLTGELLRLVDDPSASVAIMACQALAKWNDRSWMDRAHARLGSFENGHDQVTMSVVLAKVGDYSGWPVIKQNLTREYYASAALSSTLYFIGMKDGQGKEVDIAQELELLAPHIEPRAKLRLAAVVLSIREEQEKRKIEGRGK